LVGWWRGESDPGDAFGDQHGALMNGARFAPGRFGEAFSFDGVNSSFVKIPRSASLDVSNEVTLEFWMKADPKNSMGRCEGIVATDFYHLEIGYLAKMGVTFAVSSDGGETYSATAHTNGGGTVVSAGEWHHVAGTYDGSEIRLYIDGRLSGKPTLHSGAISPMLPASFLTIGSEDGRMADTNCIGTRYFHGLIDEVAIYNRALTAGEIAAINDAGKLPPETVAAAPGIFSPDLKKSGR
jgi:hypothetical protein